MSVATTPQPPDWHATRKVVRDLAREARAEARRTGDDAMISIAAAFTGIETTAADQARIATATHKRLLRAGVPPLDPANPDAPLDQTLAEIWALALDQCGELVRDIESALTAPAADVVH